MKKDFEEVWQSIVENQEREFHAQRGVPFSYFVNSSDYITVISQKGNRRPIRKSEFKNIYYSRHFPDKGPGFFNKEENKPAYSWASSYIVALLKNEKVIATNLSKENTAQDSARKKVERDIWERRGQKKYRETLLKTYQNKCAITACNATEALEAAHIIPVSMDGNHEITNGLLLRADIHTLFDLNLIGIDSEQDYKVILSRALANTTYGKELENSHLRLPEAKENYPNKMSLNEHLAKLQ